MQSLNSSPDTIYSVTADNFVRLAVDADERKSNRRVKIEELIPHLKPDGISIMSYRMLHNDCEWRTRWIVAVNADAPGAQQADSEGELHFIECWLDVSFEIFSECVSSTLPDTIQQLKDGKSDAE